MGDPIILRNFDFDLILPMAVEYYDVATVDYCSGMKDMTTGTTDDLRTKLTDKEFNEHK